MAVYKRDIADINLETGNIQRTFLNHSIGLHDKKADHFGIRVFRNGEPVDLSGVSVQGVFMPPQGSPIAITSGNIVSGNVAEVVLPDACYNYDGQFCLAIRLVDVTNSVTDTVRIVDGVVDNTHSGGTISPLPVEPTWAEIKAAYEQAIAAISTVNAMAGKMAVDITAGAEATSNNSFKDLGNRWMTFRRGYYSTPSAGSTSSYTDDVNYVYALVACAPGDVLHAHGYGDGTSKSAWAFLDSSLKILDKGGSGNYEGATDPAPTSTAFALVNVKLASLGSGYYGWTGPEAIKDQIANLYTVLNGQIDNVDKIISKLNSNIIVGKWQIGAVKTSDATVNIPITPDKSKTAFRTCIMPCAEGDMIWMGAENADTTHRPWMFVDISGNVLSAHDSNSYSGRLKAPTNSAYFVANTRANSETGIFNQYVIKGDIALYPDADNTIFELIKGLSDITLYPWIYYCKVPTGVSTCDPTVFAADKLYRCCVIPCNAGDVFFIKVNNTGVNYRPWTFVDSSNNVLRQRTQGSESNGEIVAPNNAVYLVVNSGRASENNDFYGYVYKNISKGNKNRDNYLALSNFENKYAGYMPETYQWKAGCIPTTTSTVNKDNILSTQNGGTDFMCCVIPCESFDQFYIYCGNAETNRRPYSFIDASGNVLEQASTKSSWGASVTAPIDSAYLVLNTGVHPASGKFEQYAHKVPPVSYLNGHQDVITKMRNISFGTNYTTFLHFSDIHSDGRNLKRIVQFGNQFANQITDIIHTGDNVDMQWSDGFDFWGAINGTEKILNCLGNHDSNVRTAGVNDFYAKTETECYTRYFAPYIENWDVTYTENKCYYYKDYASGVRLIVLNTNHYSDDQYAWFSDLLTDALTNEKHVIIGLHTRAYFPEIQQDTPFHDTYITPPSPSHNPNYMEYCQLKYLQAVQSFIDAGGTFVCWFGGHTHRDIFTKIESFPDQLQICIGIAGPMYRSFSGEYRVAATKTQDLFNVMTVDVDRKALKIVRFGADYNYLVRHKDTLIYKYDTGEII